MAEAGDAGTGGAGGTGGTGGTAPWYQGVTGADSEMVGTWTNKGWHTKSAPEVAIEATKAYQAAQKFVGAPADELLRVPKDVADEAGWNKVWSRLGKPADAKEYDFTGIKNADGTPRVDAFTDFMRAQAFALNMPKEAAASLAAKMAKFNDDAATTSATERAAAVATEKTELTKNWGANFEANKFVATQAAKALGVDPATVSALEGVIGYAKVMEMFRNIGTKIGEDKFVSGGGAGGNGVMTKDQAVARKAELMADKEWTKSYLNRDAAKMREMTALNTMIVGTQG